MSEIRHGNWGRDFSGSGYNCSYPARCSVGGAHLMRHCGVKHVGMPEGETCQAIQVFCHQNGNRIIRDLDQEDRIRQGRPRRY